MFCISYSYDCKNHNIIKMYLPNARMSQSAVTHLPLKSLSTAKLGKKQRDYKETNLSITDSKFLALQAMLKICIGCFIIFAPRALYLARTCHAATSSHSIYSLSFAEGTKPRPSQGFQRSPNAQTPDSHSPLNYLYCHCSKLPNCNAL